jgi:MoxR-like ATPase
VIAGQALSPADTANAATAILDELENAVVGRRKALELVLIGILAGGHVLLEDLPGLGKTLIARSFARVLGLDFARIQFTPDLLPSDVVGAPLYDQRTGDMVFRAGPVFTQLLLADEINRTPPKTQAALLEAMGEGQVSIDGQTRPLPRPFIVLATDNPIEYEGTYELPEAQLDRFLMRLRLGYLTADHETDMLRRRVQRATENVPLAPVTDAAGVIAMRESLERVEVAPELLDYIVAIVAATRKDPQVQVGAPPRRGPARLRDTRRHQAGGRPGPGAPGHAAPRAVGPPGLLRRRRRPPARLRANPRDVAAGRRRPARRGPLAAPAQFTA